MNYMERFLKNRLIQLKLENKHSTAAIRPLAARLITFHFTTFPIGHHKNGTRKSDNLKFRDNRFGFLKPCTKGKTNERELYFNNFEKKRENIITGRNNERCKQIKSQCVIFFVSHIFLPGRVKPFPDQLG